MKQLLIIALCIVPLLAVQGYEERSNQSCDKETLGMYWDTQKCEPCGSTNCYCSKTYACESCPTAYTLYSLDWWKEQYAEKPNQCYACAQGFGSYTDTVQCCVTAALGYQEANDYLALRSSTCADNTNRGTYPTYLFGSICHDEIGCQTFNEVGLCVTCYESYYLDRNQVCQKCTAYDGANWSNICKSCTGPNECQVCIDGMYLLTKTTSDGYPQELQDNPSVCKLCDANCLCKGSNKGEDKCDSCVSKQYYYEEKACKPCSEIDHCQECTNGTTCTLCVQTRASLGYGLEGRYKLNKGSCHKGPDYCNDTIMIDDETTACSATGCDNGTYPQKNDGNSGYSCIRCNTVDANAIRCNSKDKKDITQCGSVVDSPDQNVPSTIPKTTTYFLLTVASEKTCLPNVNNCKQMIDPATDETKQKCASCYTEYGQIKAKNNICYSCTSKTSNACTACKQGDGDDEIWCTACVTGQDDTETWNSPAANYFVDNNSCTACSTGCQSCKEAAKCDTCQTGYYKDGDSCTQCLTNCAKCSDTTTCSTCYPFYVTSKDKKKCLKCNDTNVTTCRKCSDDRLTCSECINGYYASNGACNIRRNSCVKWGSSGACSVCTYGNRAVNGFCESGFVKSEAYVNLNIQCTEQKYQADRLWLPVNASLLQFMMTTLFIMITFLFI